MNRVLPMALVVAVMVLWPAAAPAQLRGKAAQEAAEYLFKQFGAKAGRGVPEIAGRIERLAAHYGDDAVRAVRKGGPEALTLVEAAGTHGDKAIKLLAAHGEHAATRVLSRPTAMKQFLHHGAEAGEVLVKHAGIAEPLIEKGGGMAVKALGAVNPRNGRRLSMVLDGELAGSAARHPELLGVVAKHGDGAMEFIWKNKGTLAGGAALTAFLVNPEPFLSGAKDLAEVAGDKVAEPVIDGAFDLLTTALIVLGVLAAGVTAAACVFARREDVFRLLRRLKPAAAPPTPPATP